MKRRVVPVDSDRLSSFDLKLQVVLFAWPTVTMVYFVVYVWLERFVGFVLAVVAFCFAAVAVALLWNTNWMLS